MVFNRRNSYLDLIIPKIKVFSINTVINATSLSLIIKTTIHRLSSACMYLCFKIEVLSYF